MEETSNNADLQDVRILIKQLELEMAQKASMESMTLMKDKLDHAENQLKELSTPWYKKKTIIGSSVGVIALVLVYILQSTLSSKPLSHFLHDTLDTKNVISDEIVESKSNINKNLELFLQGKVSEKSTWFQGAFRSLATKYPTLSFHGHYIFNEEKSLILSSNCKREIKSSRDDVITSISDDCWAKKKNSELNLPYYSADSGSAIVVAFISQTKNINGIDTTIEITNNKIPLVFSLDGNILKLNQRPFSSIFSTVIPPNVPKQKKFQGSVSGLRMLHVEPITGFDYESEIELHVLILTSPT